MIQKLYRMHLLDFNTVKVHRMPECTLVVDRCFRFLDLEHIESFF